MSILVTGATGFVGGALVRRLAQMRQEVHAVVRPQSNVDSLANLEGVKIHRHDGTTKDLCGILNAAAPETVLHLASMFRADHEPSDLDPLIRTNVLFSAQVAEAAVRAGVRRLVNAGTAWQHYCDADYDPVCLYAAAKQACESILEYYARACGLYVITLILSDTYGPGDSRPKLFSLLRNAATRGERLSMSPGEQKLDLVYIDDVVEAFLQAAVRLRTERVEVPQRYAVRTGRALSLREIVARYRDAGGATPVIDWGNRPYRSREVMSPWSGGTTLPGWHAAVALEEGLRRMVAHNV